MVQDSNQNQIQWTNLSIGVVYTYTYICFGKERSNFGWVWEKSDGRERAWVKWEDGSTEQGIISILHRIFQLKTISRRDLSTVYITATVAASTAAATAVKPQTSFIQWMEICSVRWCIVAKYQLTQRRRRLFLLHILAEGGISVH